MKKVLVLSCALALAGLSNIALAADGGQAFVRAEVGSTDVDVRTREGKGSDSDSAYAVRGGYWFNRNFAVEGFYTSLYDISEQGASLKLSGVGVGVAAKKYAASDDTGFYVDFRAGVAHLKGEASHAVIGSVDDNSTKGYVGLGVGYDINESFGVGLNYDWYRAGFPGMKVDAGTVSLAGEYRF